MGFCCTNTSNDSKETNLLKSHSNTSIDKIIKIQSRIRGFLARKRVKLIHGFAPKKELMKYRILT